MRSPFQVPTGCPAIVVDTNFLGSLPFCSVPSFADPTFAPRMAPQLAPDIAPPDPCQCLSFHVTGVERIATGPKISMHVAPSSSDCCEGVHTVSLFMDVPCMPLTVAAYGAVTMPPGISAGAATARVSLRKSDVSHCGLSLKVDIEVPCIPFDLDATAAVSVKNMDPDAAALTFKFSQRPNACAMLATIDLDVPCVPFDLAPAAPVGGTISVMSDPGLDPEMTLDLGLAKTTCAVRVTGAYHLRLPAGFCVEGDADNLGNYKSIQVYTA